MVTGISLAHFSGSLNNFLNLTGNGYLLDAIGLNLIIFSCFVWFFSSKRTTNNILVNLIILLDVAWVLGSLLIVIFQLFNLSVNGYLLIATIAVLIGFLAYKQWNGFKKTKNT
ncbi:hypothetical protein FB2170_11766 [Maribacter sp. HTCC2170]|nr:hypothetical protein FB2170_11766 [Maribacter sp. HTCC2170]